MNFKGNKEDWMQAYSLFNLLGARKLINRDILDIFRTDAEGVIRYQIVDKEVVCKFEHEEFDRIPCKEFTDMATQLFEEVRSWKENEDGEVEYAAQILKRLRLTDLYSFAEERSAFTVRTVEGARPVVIRPKLNGGCTIMASHRAGNIKYEVQNLKLNNPTANKLNRLDGPDPLMARYYEIERLGGRLKYADPENRIFKNSLSLIDLHFPKLYAEMMKLFFTTDNITVKDIVEEIKKSNPFKINDDLLTKHAYYEYKVKQLLTICVFGFKPSKMWKGRLSDNYPIFVEKDGKLTFFGPAYREELEEYLYDNCRFRLADDPSKHHFGQVEKENGLYYFKLNADLVLR